MKRLGIKYLKEGMEIARPIYRADGRIVLGVNVELTEDYILRLPTQGITSIYVKDDRTTDIEVIDILSDNMRTLALTEAKKINDKLLEIYNKSKDKKINEKIMKNELEIVHERLNKLGKEMVEDFMRIRNPLINLIDTRLNEDYIYAHMVNVAAVSILIGRALGYNFEKLVDLAKGALIHDIGIIIGIPYEVRNKSGKLTEEELVMMKLHPKIGYDFIRKMTGINILSAHVAYQHHERYNGHGYPRGLSDGNISEYGYVAGIADVYDAITNNKSYKLRVLPDKAREFFMVARDKFFPAYIVDSFLNKVPAYPNGTTLILSDGSEAVVLKQNKDNLSRPWVRILNSNGKDWADVNLINELNIGIEKILD
ncbi:HD-GYP domain-containing protein [Haliovirga abyssi]|uniref:C-di-GMP phosphodiesterase n=1 Tax=Haliovirga abyssi TaxID=2996794 RepID=A0AAU9DXA5_9FUSO|nr:HD domain-containing phosphohydrolase [Haliovirga abyssi]BDU49985.1 c-di-GMP phosphodiesterase [Haliovirga abyssi]